MKEDKLRRAQQAEIKAQFWTGAYMASYAIMLFHAPDCGADVLDSQARNHADWVIRAIADKEAQLIREAQE